MDLLLSLLTLKQKNSMDLKNLQIIVDNWIKEHGVRYFDELVQYHPGMDCVTQLMEKF